jgi:hypothetical protein
MSENETTAVAQDADLVQPAREAEKSIRSALEAGTPLTLLIGTGVSKGLLKKTATGAARLCSWDGFVFSLCREAGGKVPSKLKGADSDALLAAGFQARRRLVSAERWREVIMAFGSKISSALLKQRSGWKAFFRQLKEKDQGFPLILTSNYDSLLAETLGCRQLVAETCNQSLNESDKKGAIPGFKMLPGFGPGAVAACFSGRLEVPLMWQLHQDGLIDKKHRYVHHVHGSATDPDSIILDPADYERVVSLGLTAPLAALLTEDRSGRVLRKAVSEDKRAHYQSGLIVVLGMGQGMYDRHLAALWTKIHHAVKPNNKSGSKPKSSPLVYWLIPADQRVKLESGMKSAIRDDPRENPENGLHRWLRIVTFESHADIPKFMEKCCNFENK